MTGRMELRSIAGRMVESRVKEHPKKRGVHHKGAGTGVGRIGWAGGLGVGCFGSLLEADINRWAQHPIS